MVGAMLAERGFDRLSFWVLVGPLIAVCYFQKIALPLGGGMQLPMAAFLIWLTVGLGCLTGHLVLHAKRLAAYALTMGVLLLTQLVGGYNPSLLSLMLMALLHLPYVFSLKTRDVPSKPLPEAEFYQKTMVVLSVLGIAQYFLQYIIGADWAFFLDTRLPDWVLLQGFNNLNAFVYGGTTYKSNGFFLQEPSVFSQMLAVALIFELIYFKNLKRSILYLLALAVTFSGTGIIILLALLPIYMLQKKRFIALFAFLVFTVTAPFWAPYVGLERTVGRATEFTSQHSSGFARFISPAIVIDQVLIPQGDKAVIFGMGAGTMFKAIQDQGFDFAASTSTWGKVIFEYGIFGSLVYFCFMGYLIFSSPRSIYLAAALFIQFWILGEYILSPIAHGLILGLLVWARKDVLPQIEKQNSPDKPVEVS